MYRALNILEIPISIACFVERKYNLFCFLKFNVIEILKKIDVLSNDFKITKQRIRNKKL